MEISGAEWNRLEDAVRERDALAELVERLRRGVLDALIAFQRNDEDAEHDALLAALRAYDEARGR